MILFAIGSVWVRCRAAARFRRRLQRLGLPRELARTLTEDYRRAFRLSDLVQGWGRNRAPR